VAYFYICFCYEQGLAVASIRFVSYSTAFSITRLLRLSHFNSRCPSQQNYGAK